MKEIEIVKNVLLSLIWYAIKNSKSEKFVILNFMYTYLRKEWGHMKGQGGIELRRNLAPNYFFGECLFCLKRKKTNEPTSKIFQKWLLSLIKLIANAIAFFLFFLNLSSSLQIRLQLYLSSKVLYARVIWSYYKLCWCQFLIFSFKRRWMSGICQN